MKYPLIIVLSLVGVVLTFYAVVGFACLYMTAPVVQEQHPCDKIQREGKQLWCMRIMSAEDSEQVTGTR